MADRKPGTKAHYPGFIEPALATSINKIPGGSRWIHEIKFDGYRVQLHIANERAPYSPETVTTGPNASRKLRTTLAYQRQVRHPRWRGRGTCRRWHDRFSVLQNELKGKSTKIAMVAFDLLYLNGYDLRKLPLIERKAQLKTLIAKTTIQFSESFEVDGPEMFKHACSIGMEGVVSKVRDSRYSSGRGNDWVKKTCAQRETLLSPVSRSMAANGMDLYLGRRKGNDLIYAGKVDHGFDSESAKELQKRLKPLIRKTQPYSKRVSSASS